MTKLFTYRRKRNEVLTQVLEALAEETRICSLDISPKLRGLAVAWNEALDEYYATSEKIRVAELLIEVLTDMWHGFD